MSAYDQMIDRAWEKVHAGREQVVDWFSTTGHPRRLIPVMSFYCDGRVLQVQIDVHHLVTLASKEAVREYLETQIAIHLITSGTC